MLISSSQKSKVNSKLSTLSRKPWESPLSRDTKDSVKNKRIFTTIKPELKNMLSRHVMRWKVIKKHYLMLLSST